MLFRSIVSTFAPDTLGWHHVALVRNNGYLTAWLNGIAVDSFYNNSSLTDGQYNVGYAFGNYFVGSIDDLRITYSALYISNFTPPAAAYTADSQTTALYHFDGDYTNAVTGTIASDYNWKNVGIAGTTPIGIKTDGTLWAWGTNSNGEFGDGSAIGTVYSAPTQIGSAINWSAVITTFADGGNTAYVGNTAGQVFGSGYNAYGQLGQGNTTNLSTLTQIGTSTKFLSVPTTTGIVGSDLFLIQSI